jgi:hypothetical protein
VDSANPAVEVESLRLAGTGVWSPVVLSSWGAAVEDAGKGMEEEREARRGSMLPDLAAGMDMASAGCGAQGWIGGCCSDWLAGRTQGDGWKEEDK